MLPPLYSAALSCLTNNSPPHGNDTNKGILVRPDTMMLHSLFSKLTLTALVGVLFPGRLALAVSNLPTSIEIPSLHSNDLAFLRQVTTGMSMVFDSAPEKYAKYFPRGRFYTSHPALDETSRAYINAHHDYLHNVTSLSSTFDLSHCELPPNSLEMLHNWSANDDAPTLPFIRTTLLAEKLRARQCARLVGEVEQKYKDLEELRLELWTMPLRRHDMTSALSCPTLLPTPTGSLHNGFETLWDCLFDASCTTSPAVAATCQESQQDLTHFHDDMEVLAQTNWGVHIWQDSVLNYPQRIARMHAAQLEISKATSLIADMEDRAVDEHLPRLTAYCKALRDRAVDSSAPSGGYTVSQWAADHVDKWTVWSQEFQIGKAISSRLGVML
jgi:hypothetical protein